MLGLFELIVVLAAGAGWAFFELRSLRRDRLAREKAAATPPGETPSQG